MYHLRKAESGEEDKIFELVKTVLSDYGLKTDPKGTDQDLSDIDRYYFNQDGWFSVIDQEGRIIGSYGIYRINDSVCELRKMYLLNEYQGQGLGKRMMEDALKKARELGYSEMILESNSVLTKALGLYRKYGFMVYTPAHLSDRCDLTMKRKI
jgi:putative acetyltransferase